MQKWFPVILVFAAAGWLAFFVASSHKGKSHRPDRSAEQIADQRRDANLGEPLPVLWDVPAFSFLDQNRKPLGDRDLRGKVWVSDFFFTSCTTICPTMTASMANLQKTITNPNVQFVSFSVDPDHDTPEILREYAKMWGADGSRWHFLSTDREKLIATAAGMKTFVQPPDRDTPIQHSSIMILSDGNGKVRGVYDGSNADAMKRLTFDAMMLAGTPLPTSDPMLAAAALPYGSNQLDDPGAQLYLERGCAACHMQAGVAPPLKGLYGKKVLLDDGRTMIADEAYLRESILDPNAKVVAGYPKLMPSYRGRITDVELMNLVAYTISLRGDAGGEMLAAASQPASAENAVDPVCKMRVAAHAPTLHAEYGGKTFYFCSPTCREQFLKSPAKFGAHPPSTQPPHG